MAYCSDDAPFPHVWTRNNAFSGKRQYSVLAEVKSNDLVFASKMDQTSFKDSDGSKAALSMSGVTFFACEEIPAPAAPAAPAAAEPSGTSG